MKRALLILILIYPILSGYTADENYSRRMETTLGFIDIKVESNINRLFFKYDLMKKSYPFGGKTFAGNTADTSAIRIVVPVKDFQCKNQFAYRDFLELMKENQFPFLTILIPRKAITGNTSGDRVIISDVLITIAGVSKRYDIDCTIDNYGKKYPVLLGTTKIMLTDLNIIPPVKTLGLIKVRNEIIVNFGFCLNNDLAIIT